MIRADANRTSVLPLKGMDWLGHYSFAIYMAALSLAAISGTLVSREPSVAVVSMAIVLAAVAFANALRQRKGLRLQHYRTQNDAQENFDRVFRLARDEQWRVGVAKKPEWIRLHVPAEWTDLCWGEMVSVVCEGQNVWVNSICDPTKPYPSLTSWGRNAANVEKVKRALESI